MSLARTRSEGGNFSFKTTVWLTSRRPHGKSREARDAVLKSGIEKGVAASYDRLAELLLSLPAHGMEKEAGESWAKQP